ncbi:MAG: hypothetical protein IKI57_06970 [Clostridia bacterium]|nr:hypothetical protein [Clostridia bacterium]
MDLIWQLVIGAVTTWVVIGIVALVVCLPEEAKPWPLVAIPVYLVAVFALAIFYGETGFFYSENVLKNIFFFAALQLPFLIASFVFGVIFDAASDDNGVSIAIFGGALLILLNAMTYVFIISGLK